MIADWTKNLHTVDAAGLRTVFHTPNEGKDARRVLDRERKHTRRAAHRTFINGLRVSNAVQALERLPGEGESMHLVLSGNFDAFDIIPAVLALAAPATIRELNLATLGFNERNTATLLAMLDAGQVERCTFICSIYFRSVADGGRIFENLHAALTHRGHACAAIRSHAKITLMELSDGRCLTWESSANLRSCRNVEQAVLTNDRDLLHFHRDWMKEAAP